MEDNELRLLAYKQLVVEKTDEYETKIIDLRVALTQSEEARYELLERLSKYEKPEGSEDEIPDEKPKTTRRNAKEASE